VFVRNDHGLDGAGGASALSFGRAPLALPAPTLATTLTNRFGEIDLVPDLGSNIGSPTWWRGAATCAALIAVTWLLSPGFSRPLIAAVDAPLAGSAWEEARALSITPLGLGANSGRRLAATAAVAPLADTPERPVIELSATLGDGADFVRTLERAGVSGADASAAAELVAAKVSLGELKPGTQLELTMGRRPTRDVARPLEALSLRARFDLDLELSRAAGALGVRAIPIAIDHTPLRIEGRVGGSLYRAARAAGAPAKAVESFIRAIAQRMPISRVGSDARFTIITERARAATGEVQLGQLLFAGLDGASKVQLVRWEDDGRVSWFDPRGIGEIRDGATTPVAGRMASGFGMRRHPVLGYLRMHKGIDWAAPHGTPIRASMDGTVALAGRNGGYGNFVKLAHAGGLASGYGHMSRIAVRPGTRVTKGQVIGYVGSTGMSTGPHLHYELWKNGAPVNPGSVSFQTVQQLSGGALASFKARFAKLMAVPAAGD
jgi:murein DD-endopeptidase MepM/ murein hydrolase activator NlpD